MASCSALLSSFLFFFPPHHNQKINRIVNHLVFEVFMVSFSLPPLLQTSHCLSFKTSVMMAQPPEPIPGVTAEHSALNSCSFNPNCRKRQPRNLFSLCFHAFSHHTPHYPLTTTKNTITNNNAILLRNVIKMYKIRVSQYTDRPKEMIFL